MLTWERTPQELGHGIGDWLDRVLDAAVALAGDWALIIQADAQDHARWQDRTGHARAGLTGRAMRDGSAIVIILFHTVGYGIWLEVAHSGNYAIIMETLTKNLQGVLNEIEQLIGG